MSEDKEQYVVAVHEPIDQRKHLVFEMLGRPIAFHRIFVTLTGSVTAALMLSQAVYWSKTGRKKGPWDGWFWKSADEWQEETGLSRREQETARKKLQQLGFWQEDLRKANGTPTLHFRVDASKLADSVNSIFTNCENPRDLPNCENPVTETTTKTTTKNIVPAAPEVSIMECFRLLLDDLRTTTNKTAKLQEIYIALYGAGSPPDFGYLGKVAKQVGGAGRLAELLLQHCGRPPTGDVLAYIVAAEKRRKQGGQESRSVVNLQFDN